jgi:filamentous hemagglutinin family protein
MMKKVLAVLLCFCIACLPAIANAGTGNKPLPLDYHKSLLPPLPKPKLANAAAVQPKLDLTVSPRKTQTASALTTSSALNASETTVSVSSLPSVPQYEVPYKWTIIGGVSPIGPSQVKNGINTLVVTQNAPQAIINWGSFNIGSKAEVDFVQQSSSWVCLNRIFDQNPSQIFGKIEAIGKIYLINQNGILFMPGSQINLHTLVASSLNISKSDFMNGLLNFQAQDYQAQLYGPTTQYLSASVINQGTITTDTLGSVFLLAPYVENDGTIQTQTGQIGLAAGTDISIYQDTSIRNWQIVSVQPTGAGNAVNNGTMTANTGLIGMYGANIDQSGTISAVTALTVAGKIELVASDSVTTGPGSITSTPVSTSTETADQSFNYSGGTISIMGLDPNNPTQPATVPQQIVINGLIQAPSGTVTMQARNSVTLGNGGSIDVSGLWINLPASANTTQVQLNSVELADYPDQKNGILHGATITVNNLLGSSIGNISGYLDTEQKTASERSLTGGSISITTPYTGEVIVNQGASINFSGGGTNYSAGNVTTTGLISGNQIYAINNAPETLQYAGITSITNYVGSYMEGVSAGRLSLLAGKIALDGNIQGSATAGVYQTRTSELLDTMGNQKTLGLQAPTGGTLIVGVLPNSVQSVELQDFTVNSVVLYGPGDQIDDQDAGTTYLSAQKLSAAGLSNLQIAANTTLTVDADADISLVPRATLSLAARQIEFSGKINVPSGTVNLIAADNLTAFEGNSRYVPLDSEILLAAGSQIDAAGQRIDNSLAATGTGGTAAFTYVAGGTVAILNESYFGEGVISAAGSMIDVSGGYGISQKGAVTGGNAGSLTIQGAGIVLDGDLKGYSLQGYNGGSITLYAQTIEAATSTPQNPQENLNPGLILGQDQLDETGFTKISLQSVGSTTIDNGVILSPSMVKLSTPVPGGNNSENSLIVVSQDLIGTSSFSLTAGKIFWQYDINGNPISPPANATIEVSAGSAVNVAPSGSISLSGPSVIIGGALSAPAGTVKIAATDLTLQTDATISAAGYNQASETPILAGLPVSYTPLSGGSVTLTAGTITMDPGSVVDVSGSSPVTTYILNGNGAPVAETVAGNPGSITISGSSLSLQGTLLGQANLAGLQGGSLSILDTGSLYTLTAPDLQNYVKGGFDALSFTSPSGLAFSGNMNISVGRSLTLDAPSFTGSGNIYLQAPSIYLQDTSANGYVSGQNPQVLSGTAYLTLAGDWISAWGYFTLSGFQGVTLSAAHDIMLSDRMYGATWQGWMLTSGDLTLVADRIYPAMDAVNTGSAFTIESSGTITVEGSSASHNSSPIYSAGGSLTIEAQNIDMEGGELAAPMGQISLIANPTSGSVTVASGSLISTPSSTLVDYGSLNNVFWTITDKANYNDVNGITVTGAPQKSVIISGSEVNVMAGSTIDVSGTGGGGVFAYQFQAGTQGTIDPLQTTAVNSANQTLWQGRYVIVSDANYSLPGQAVYLQGCAGLKAGVYSILPVQYAFLPGAMVVTATGATVASGTKEVSADGFPIVAGYLTYMGTSIQPSLMQAFEVQPASYLLTQGTFNTAKFVAGAGGNVSITANTTVVDGTIAANAMSGYQGGTISLSGTNAFVEESSSQVPSNPASGTLYVAADALTGFNVIDIGNLNSNAGAVTGMIEVEPGSILQATQVVLSAQKSITLDSGAQIVTVETSGNGNGSTSLITPTGLLTMQQNSLVHASDTVTMTIGQLNFQGGLQIDHGTLNLTGQNVYFVPAQGTSPSNPDPLGLYLANTFWSNFANFNDLNISASGGYSDGSVRGLVGFLGGISLSAKNSFTINAAAIEGLHTVDNGDVVINAPTISLLNRGGGTPLNPSLSNTGSLTLQNANYIYIGEGAFLNGLAPDNPNPNGLLIDGFATVNFNAKNDISFLGTGSLVTGAGNLNFKSARVTTSYYTDANTAYTAANFTLSAANTNVSIAPNGVAPSQTVTPGGTLEIDANSIDVSGVIEMASGTLTLHATGTDGVTLSGTAQVLDGGSIEAITVNGQTTCSCSPGGSVYLNADSGPVNIAAGALVYVSGVQEDNYAYAQQNKMNYNIFTDPNDIGVNAGLISIYSPNAPVSLKGTLSGTAGYWKSYDGSSVTKGTGGSFVLDAEDLSNNSAVDKGFSALNTILNNGGFTEEIDVRLRGTSTPNEVLTIGDTIVANNFNLTADNWSIDFSGTIGSPSVSGGGTIQFNSGGYLKLEASSQIMSPGATVFLNTADGNPNQPGNLIFYGLIDVTGVSGQAAGTVHFRAPWSSYYGANANSLIGVITGASQILAEGVLYGGNSGVSTQQATYTANNGTISSGTIGSWLSGIQGFTNGASTPAGLSPTLLNCGGAARFVPGLEVRSSGDLTLQDTWDFTNGGASYGSWDTIGTAPGFVTLMAGGNLYINANLVDYPTSLVHPVNTYEYLYGDNAKQSWGMTLVSGADLTSSDPTAFIKGNGNLTIGTAGNWVTVYTENAPLILAAGGNLIVNPSDPGTPTALGYMINSTMYYNVATYSGAISVAAGDGITLAYGGIIQSATGNIDVRTGGDLTLWDANNPTDLGAIRTTGTSTVSQLSNFRRNNPAYWTYSDGGNISIYVEGNVNGYSTESTSGNLDLDGWDSFNLYHTISYAQGWSASYIDSNLSASTVGLATMAGGNLTVYAGGSFNCQAGTFSPYSYTWDTTRTTLLSSTATNDASNLTIFSGDNMEGRFLIADGIGELHSMGGFGGLAPDRTTYLPIELFTAALNVSAQGNIDVGAIVNPTITRPVGSSDTASNMWNLEYAPTTSVSLTAVTGNVTLYGGDNFYGNFGGIGNASLTILPPTVTITAGGNINFLSNFTLAPYALGNLSLTAGENINGELANGLQAMILMSDMSDALPGQSYNEVYGVQQMTNSYVLAGGGLTVAYLYEDPAGLLHANDPTSALVNAGGNIANLAFYMPKQADIVAGGNINNVFYNGHNNNAGDVTIIRAGDSIVFSSEENALRVDTGIEVGGPGALVVEAGDSMDLGTSAGITVLGNALDTQYPSQLPSTGCTLIVASGYDKDFSNITADTQFFMGTTQQAGLQAEGQTYSEDLAAGRTAQAALDVAEARADTIDPFFAGSATSGSGDINMTASQISSLAPTAGIFIVTHGSLNVGQSTFFANESEITQTGIFTAQGGGINIFANKDVNVNESRVMTFEGGDITVWSDTGNINAGRGSRTAVNASPPSTTSINGQVVVAFSPPSVGSGIRAVTYAPGWGIPAPPAGNINLFAPQGDIDAGEAGIAGNKVTLGAVQVLNANNISFSAGSVGVPSASQGISGLSALSGVGSVTQTMQTQETAMAGAAGNKLAQAFAAAPEAFISSLEVKVLSVFNADPSDSSWEKTDN